VKAAELTLGRTFGVTFDHGDGFLESLARFCRDNDVRQGYVPSFIAGLAEARIVGACEKLEDPEVPVWSAVHVTNVEAFGGGTFTHDEDGTFSPHIHVTVGEKARSATGYTSHLLSAKVQFLTEMLVHEVLSPTMTRRRDPDLYDVPLLTFAKERPSSVRSPEV
jgi:predicted DNA-binding protein with PD1-like motif